MVKITSLGVNLFSNLGRVFQTVGDGDFEDHFGNATGCEYMR